MQKLFLWTKAWPAGHSGMCKSTWFKQQPSLMEIQGAAGLEDVMVESRVAKKLGTREVIAVDVGRRLKFKWIGAM